MCQAGAAFTANRQSATASPRSMSWEELISLQQAYTTDHAAKVLAQDTLPTLKRTRRSHANDSRTSSKSSVVSTSSLRATDEAFAIGLDAEILRKLDDAITDLRQMNLDMEELQRHMVASMNDPQ
eukprot:TRINITY_DN76713_c0_g1_i1.p1 TRINITY_DN76713_c0_g1~~TRINITY_DN76713_c0_g1_i1.p1  ORF type:complete len:125 (-),score=18.20 TRINITY_DN76713_c0_g1_i1:101-475(-)